MKQLIKPAVLFTAALSALLVASCAYSFFGETASIRVSISLAGNRGLGDAGSPRLLRPDTAYIVVEVSGSDMSTISSGKSPIDSSTGTASVRLENIPISSLERKITISAYSDAGLLLSSGSSTRILVRGANDVAIVLSPAQVDATLASAWHLVIGIPQSSPYVAQLSLPDTGDYCLSLGYSTAQFMVYDSTGRPAERVAGSPENWFILHGSPEPSCYVMIRSPDVQETLKIEKAVYVSPGASGTNEGTRANPLTGFTSATYASIASPSRFLLARGAYGNTNLQVAQGNSIYGGFDPSTWSRNLGPGVPMTELRGASNGASVIYGAAGINGDTVVDGVWIRASAISGDNLTGSYYAADFNSSPSIRNCRITGPEVAAGSGLSAIFHALHFGYSESSTIPVHIVGNLISAGSISVNDSAATAEIYGIYAFGGNSHLIVANNEIDGGYVASGSVASQITGSAAVFQGTAWVINNTIGSGKLDSSGASTIYGILCGTSSSSLHIINNAIIDSETSTAGVTSSCVFAAADPGNRPVHLMNNYSGQRALDPDPGLLSSAYVFLIDPASYIFQDSLDAANGSDPAGQALANVSGFFNPAYFASYGDPSLLSAFSLNRDWSLSAASPQELKSGAIGYQTLLSANIGLPSNLLPYLLYDRRSKLRPVSGWSMGAYQY
jgi:hypothetical protein